MNGQKLDDLKNEIRQKQHDFTRELVQSTFEILEAFEKEKNTLQSKIKILKHDLFDFKDGRIDRVMERQEMDPLAKETSVMLIEKIPGQQNSSPWYIEYLVKLKAKGIEMKINNSSVKSNASGSYKLSDNSIKYL